ncbi:hypothetical protein GCM10023065_15610 [Microbacterium laevaniformans]|uniref:hypothetical protein n=1 Tax=Microbacterium laevaniformans TaxID=36807 RepID=UPI0019588CC5|nr:hypothetical protein [Microbacterium laevaniformans]MBM7752512.1 hypothetical protein [Microbacterium laevaniformans]GLJ63420.1 hypothetical protein GCM10017578_03070 [Microbacterium laevaniformans]
MSTWVLADLRSKRSWNIGSLGVDAFTWPADAPLRQLGDVAHVLSAVEEVEPEFPVITPQSIDSVTGVLRRRRRGYIGAAFRVGGFGRALHSGDILVPPIDVPALFVNETLIGSLASSQFLAVRADPSLIDSNWLWGALNSRSGRALRRLVTAESSGKLEATAALLRMTLPVPSLEEQRAAAYPLAAIEQRLRGQEQEGPTTWWRAADLRGQQWRFALASANPSLMQDGEPLGDYGEIARGRQSRSRGDEPVDPAAGVLPLATGMYLAGRRDEVAPVLPDSLIAQPGDVLVAVIGERPMAQVVSQPMLVSDTVYRIRPNEWILAPAIASFLNSAIGLARWRFLALDGTVPQMRLSDLRQFPVPTGALDTQAGDVLPMGPLDAQLESILWPS